MSRTRGSKPRPVDHPLADVTQHRHEYPECLEPLVLGLAFLVTLVELLDDDNKTEHAEHVAEVPVVDVETRAAYGTNKGPLTSSEL